MMVIFFYMGIVGPTSHGGYFYWTIIGACETRSLVFQWNEDLMKFAKSVYLFANHFLSQ